MTDKQNKAEIKKVVIVGMARTPFGSYQGALSSLPAPKLGSIAIEGALKNAGVNPDQVSEVIMGNVLTAGEGQAPARQAALGAGLSKSTPCLTINKVCGSGMKAIMLATQSIRLGDSETVVAGGMENMSQAPYLLQGAREGLRMGNKPFVDSMILDGLWDPYNDQHMGTCAELCAKEKKFTREIQDEYATLSFKRAQESQKEGRFKNEIVPVTIKTRKGDVIVNEDEGPGKVKFEKISTLRPAFDKQGSVTAANASTINDGACALVLTSEENAKSKGLKILGEVVTYSTYAHEPEWFTTAPVTAMKDAIEKAGWSVGDIDQFEVNEAFAVVALAAEKEVGIPREKLNPWGGAISLGHPIGASGARIVMTLLSGLNANDGKKGLAGICIGGGEATAICIKR